jgi:hypothetical protein
MREILVHFFANLYEWFGLMHIYSKDMSDFLKGWDYACTGYFALPWYTLIGLVMVILTTLIFALQYDLISAVRFKKSEHWELAAIVVVICNFIIAFTIPFVAINKEMLCPQLKLSASDCIFFGLSNAIWSLIFFSILTGIRRFILKS